MQRIEANMAWVATEDHRLLELADIFEWKRTRIKSR